MNYLISYDITDDKLRTKIAKVLEDYGDRAQFSLFELPELDDELFNQCLLRLEKLAKKFDQSDSIRIYYICNSCKPKIKIIGAGEAMQNPDVYIL